MTNNILNATMAGGIEIIPAGKTKLVLQINTTDRENLSTASWAITATGKSYTATADASGRAEILVDSGYTYTVTLTHDGQYENDAPQDVVARSTETTWVYFDLFYYPAASNVTFVRLEGAGAGVDVTATHGSTVNTSKTDALGTATFRGLEPGESWSFTATGYTKVAVEIVDLVQEVAIEKLILFGMDFDPVTFKTDPTGCLTYTDDCAGFTPVSGPVSGTSRAKPTVMGDWDMFGDGTDNKLLDKCFYMMYSETEDSLWKLDPQNLLNFTAKWDHDRKEWVPTSGTESNRNILFCIPTLYLDSNETHISLSNDPSRGTAFAHTIDGHTYQYLGIGVFAASTYTYTGTGRKVLRSLWGTSATTGYNHPGFRANLSGNTLGGISDFVPLMWNFYQWNLWRIMTIFATKSFDSQSRIGRGVDYQSAPSTSGAGPFLGSTGASHVKAYIESAWGGHRVCIDDARFNPEGGQRILYAGQNGKATDDLTNKVPVGSVTAGFAGTISTDPRGWGLAMDAAGSSSTGLCDRMSGFNTIPFVCGLGANDTEIPKRGISYLESLNSGDSSVTFMERLAYVFDLER